MIAKYKLWFQAGALALVLLAAFSAGWSWQGALGKAALETARGLHQADLGEISRAAAQQLRDQQAQLVAERKRLDQLDTDHYLELNNAQAENEALRRDYSSADAERKRLRIEVRVARADVVVSETIGTGGVGDVAAVELSAAAGQSVWDIRAGMIEDQRKLMYLQDLVRVQQAPGSE